MYDCANVKILIIFHLFTSANNISCLVQIMDLVGELFPFIFTKIEERCPKELESVRKQYPFQSLKVIYLLDS